MNAEEISSLDLGSDLEITQTNSRRSVPGTWVSGTVHGHRFEALVFPEHAETPAYEIGDSRISKLWLARQADGAVVYNWDRGQDIAAANPEAQGIVDFLCAGLAEYIDGN